MRPKKQRRQEGNRKKNNSDGPEGGAAGSSQSTADRSDNARLVKLRRLSLPHGLNVGTENLAVICTRMTRLESVGHLRSSTATAVDLSGLSQLTTVGDYFLRNCTSLTTVDLSGLSQLTTVGDSFLERCSSLTTVDLSGLSHLCSIGKYFLNRCPACVRADGGVSEVLSRRAAQFIRK